ncbi:AraC family transcriptional regulator [Actinophytocola oryzae]|uniref:AraC-like DNA-binding protein n=1 Tax=Actinophytocola oryzae TaxID=502181 RepID=A0A4R7W5A7_9PSEU|nr:AraC family transcriptional regulator [Actinophytocola oryzae]TDV57752.1 AraC-like DNA-binding protein [Actinophytocola oryzae]
MEWEDVAHYWRHPAVSGVDLMRARFVRHGFTRHTHETFALGVVRAGTEDLWVGGARHLVSAGGVVLLNPEEVHTGGPVDDVGWAYRVFYPSVEVVAAATGCPDPWFTRPIVADPEAAAVIGQAHLAAESADRLASETLLTTALSLLWQGYGGGRRVVEPSGGTREVAAVRDLLQARLVDPPSLGELAATVGTSRFALLRAFRARYGLPPHAYLNQLRVRRARVLLDDGVPAAEVAVAVGFADQSHLSRHFRRLVGLTPGRYQRNNVQARGPAGP